MKNTNLYLLILLKIKQRQRVGSLFYLLFLFLSIQLNTLQAQSLVSIKGLVVDATGDPIIGANVLVKGTKVGTITDLTGAFVIDADLNASLKISYLGYEPSEVQISESSKQLRVVLAEKNKSLDEVVVIGYGTTTKRDLTSSISKLDVKSASNISVGSINEAMAGRIAGVQATSSSGKPGDEVSIVIRGSNSITSNPSPLFVIDGFVTADDYIKTINPSDIETMEILKDASATSIYGARGANGVIIISTKKGTVGAPTVNYKSFYGMQSTNAHVDVLNPYEFVKLQTTLSGEATKNYLTDKKMTLDDYKSMQFVDWQKMIFRESPLQSHSLSVSGGTQDTRYNISTSYFNQEGIIINSSSKRYTAKISLDQNFSKTFKVGASASYALNGVYGTSPNSFNTNLLYNTWSYMPWVLNGQDPANVDFTDGTTDFRNNPIASAVNDYNQNLTTTIIGNAFAQYEPIKGLMFKVQGSVSSSVTENETFNNLMTRVARSKQSASGSMSQRSIFNWMNDYTVNYNKTFDKKHKFTALLGVTASGTALGSYSFGAQDLYRDDLGLNGLAMGTPTIVSVSSSNSVIASAISRITYGYDNKYLFSSSLREDGSSRFGANNRWAYFPSSSFAWVLSEESFMKEFQSVVSNTKLRASWGRTGNCNVGDFATLGQYIGSNGAKPYAYYFGGALNLATVKSQMENPNLKWETTEQTDLGVDLGLFKQRVRVEADYFYKKTSDLLLNANMPNSSGFDKSYMNIGKVQNQGFELTISSDNIRSKNFKWSTDFNISFIRNKVVELANDQPSQTMTVGWGYNTNTTYNLPAYIAVVGRPLSQMYGYISDGLLTSSDIANNYPSERGTTVTPGYMKYKDLNGDGKIDQYDRTIIGDANPKHFGGFTNKFEFYGFDLNIFMQWVYGQDILNVNPNLYTAASPINYNVSTAILDAFSGANPNGKIPTIGSQRTNTAYYSDMVEDGSYLKLRSVQFGYSIPSNLLKKVSVKSLRLYCSAENIYTFTHYSGFDPEVSTANSPMTRNFDFSNYPRALTMSFGVNLTL